MALVGVELEMLVFEPDAQTTRPPPCAIGHRIKVCYYIEIVAYLAKTYCQKKIFKFVVPEIFYQS